MSLLVGGAGFFTVLTEYNVAGLNKAYWGTNPGRAMSGAGDTASRYKKPRRDLRLDVPARQPPSKAFPRLTPLFALLDACLESHRDVSDKLIGERIAMTEFDLFLLGFVKRSLDLLAAIRILVEQWNYSAMAPLVRLQVDTLVRLRYLTTSPDREKITAHVLKGVSFRKLKDASGQQLTDARLLQLAEPNYPWLRSIYEETSNVVHFTVGHLTVPLVFHERPHVSVDMEVGLSRWSEGRIRECLDGAVQLSTEILRLASISSAGGGLTHRDGP